MQRLLLASSVLFLATAGASCTDSGTTFTFDAGTTTDTKTTSDATQSDTGNSTDGGSSDAGDGAANDVQ